jgi:hypothetical protein
MRYIDPNSYDVKVKTWEILYHSDSSTETSVLEAVRCLERKLTVNMLTFVRSET